MAVSTNGSQRPGFRHEALLYAGAGDFADRAVPVIATAVQAGEPVLVAVDVAKAELLHERLGSHSSRVQWVDIRAIGRNPARIIPVWRQFVAGHPGRRLWGFGEPAWAGRSPAEMAEVQRHERLLNLAFAGAADFTLLCPYDTLSLDADVVEGAHLSHPHVVSGAREESPAFVGLDVIARPQAALLAEPPARRAELLLDGSSAEGLRAFVGEHVAEAELDPAQLDHLTLAIAAVNGSMTAPGSRARLRVWQGSGAAIAELDDLAALADPLVGREWPPPSGGPTRGLWLANQLCDLVEVGSGPGGTVVRLHLHR